MRKINKKADGAIGMSFGWIFSLILIVFFIFAAIYGIKAFLNMANCTKVGLFYESLQDSIDEAYRSSSTDIEIEVNVPGIKQICFANLSEKITGPLAAYDAISIYEGYNANTYLVPPEKGCTMPYKNLNRLNISKTTQAKNPLCFDITDGGKIRIVKEYYDKWVTIK